jgi:hypothetical protein
MFISFDSIEFDYAGKPCYIECLGITDSFTRTVVSGWGTSDYGSAWVSTLGTGTAASVSGSYAILQASTADSSRVDLPASISDVFDLTFDVWHQAMNPADPGTVWAFLATTQSGYQFHVNVTVGEMAQMYIQTNGVDYTTIDGFTLTLHTWYRVRFKRDSTTLYVKFWEVGTSEPGSWTATCSAVSPYAFSGSPRTAQFDMWNAESVSEIWIDNLDIPDLPSCAPVAPVAGVPPAGYVCETILNAVGTHFHTTHLFAAMSLEVYINSLRQFGNYTYDGTTKTFDLDSPVVASDHLRVCYTAVSRSLYGSPS